MAKEVFVPVAIETISLFIYKLVINKRCICLLKYLVIEIIYTSFLNKVQLYVFYFFTRRVIFTSLS